ncbi:MAG: response regulator [Gemmatimonadota bacterium]|nr:response regulator [Gemmatimonadota bacterium]
MAVAAQALEVRHARILCVEPDPQMRAVLENIVRHSGYDTCSAASVHDALAVLYHETVDVVVTRHPVPTQHGVELTGLLRAEGLETPVLVLSTTAGTTDVVALADGAPRQYLLQPVDPRVVRSAIHRVMADAGGATADETVTALPGNVRGSAPVVPAVVVLEDLNVTQAEERLIAVALERTGYNRTVAAAMLGMHVRTLRRKLKAMRGRLPLSAAATVAFVEA